MRIKQNEITANFATKFFFPYEKFPQHSKWCNSKSEIAFISRVVNLELISLISRHVAQIARESVVKSKEQKDKKNRKGRLLSRAPLPKNRLYAIFLEISRRQPASVFVSRSCSDNRECVNESHWSREEIN